MTFKTHRRKMNICFFLVIGISSIIANLTENEMDESNKGQTVLKFDSSDDFKISDNIVHRQDDINVNKKSERKLRRRSPKKSKTRKNRILRRLDSLEAIVNAEVQYRKEDTKLIVERISNIELMLNTTFQSNIDGISAMKDHVNTNDLISLMNETQDTLKSIVKAFSDEKVLNSKIRKQFPILADACSSTPNVTNIYNQLNRLSEGIETIKTTFKVNETDKSKMNEAVPVKTSCKELYNDGFRTNGVYNVTPNGQIKVIQVYCDQTTDGGGWTVFQRRQNGEVNFNRGWVDYKRGFGTVDSEFWLGNKHVQQLIGSDYRELRIDMTDFEGVSKFARYSSFKIYAGDSYKLYIDGFTGNVTSLPSFRYYHHDMPFSTFDRDHDNDSNTNCAQLYKSGWWYNSCTMFNLNGPYLNGTHDDASRGIHWHEWHGYKYSLKFTEMKFR